MNSKHTPGPWKAGKARKSLSRDPELWTADVDGKDLLVAADVRGVGQIECEANAHLIAAAPELLEALKEMVDAYGCECCDHEKPGHCPMCIGRAAIALAEGNFERKDL